MKTLITSTLVVGAALSMHATAQVYSYDWSAPNSSSAVGLGGNEPAWKSLSVSFDSNTNILSFSSTLNNAEIDISQYGPFDSAPTGEWGMINFVVTDGPEPSNQSNPATHAVITLEYNNNNPLLSLNEYSFDLAQGGGSPAVQSAFTAVSVTDAGSERTFSGQVELSGNQLLTASHFTNTMGLWARAWADYEISYDSSGNMTKYKPDYLANGSTTNISFWDASNVTTTVTPEPSSALLSAISLGLCAIRRRRE